MPNGKKNPKSLAQNRLMQAVAHGSAKNTGIPKTVAVEFTAGAHGKKLTKLPQHVAKKRD